MPRRLTSALARIRRCARARRVSFTLKARQELAALEPGLDEEDACHVLGRLQTRDAAGRLKSHATGEWMYVFKPSLAGTKLYVKVVLRSDCIVISFHEDNP